MTPSEYKAAMEEMPPAALSGADPPPGKNGALVKKSRINYKKSRKIFDV